jgi:hypothetical protein
MAVIFPLCTLVASYAAASLLVSVGDSTPPNGGIPRQLSRPSRFSLRGLHLPRCMPLSPPSFRSERQPTVPMRIPQLLLAFRRCDDTDAVRCLTQDSPSDRLRSDSAHDRPRPRLRCGEKRIRRHRSSPRSRALIGHVVGLSLTSLLSLDRSCLRSVAVDCPPSPPLSGQIFGHPRHS